MKKLSTWINEHIDNFNIRRKLMIMYVFCVMLPLIITDSLILGIVMSSEQKNKQHEMENIANAVTYTFTNEVETASKLAKGVCTSKYIDDFLNTHYISALDYVTKYQSFFKDTMLQVGAGQNNLQLTFFSENSSIIRGSEFQPITDIEDTEMYKEFIHSGKDSGLFFDYQELGSPATKAKRKIYFLKKLDFYNRTRNILQIEIEYTSLYHLFENMNYNTDMYICSGDRIIISNGKNGSVRKPFGIFSEVDDVGFKQDMDIYGQDLVVYVMKNNRSAMTAILKHTPLILLLIIINVLLPLSMVYFIHNSFTTRLRELRTAFGRVEDEKLVEIMNPRGQDEIGALMRNYNIMARRINDLIQIVYKNRLKEQEMMVARQNAELLALHSQINPHFLFNALESIRMHSLIKHELETADMVQKLAVMQRQYVEWDTDSVRVEKEMEFVEAYLGLQKYRFGDRLSYELEVGDGCNECMIPKLSIVTFVENACVHGIESKTKPGWIFVRIYEEDENLCIEVEDTGNGMEEDEAEQLQYKMDHACIEMLKDKGRVGIVNACLRIKMIAKGEAHFEVESEPYVGTLVQVKIPMKAVQTDNEQ